MKILVHLAPPRSGHNFLKLNLCSWLGIEWRLHYWNYEGVSPVFFHKRYDKESSKYIQTVERSAKRFTRRIDTNVQFIKVLSNRDLLDWLASIYKQGERAGGKPGVMDLSSWGEYTEEIGNPHSEFITFTYDSFRDSRRYRQDLCKEIGGEYGEGLLDQIPKAGKGSSFSGTGGKGSDLQTGERYRHYVDNEIYKENLRSYPQVVDLYRRVFSPSPEKLAFLESLDK